MWFIVEALFFQYRSSFGNLNAINANPILFIQNVITNTNKNASFWFLNVKIILKLTIDTHTVRIDISAHSHFGPHFISVLYLKLLGIKRALNIQISIIEFRQESLLIFLLCQFSSFRFQSIRLCFECYSSRYRAECWLFWPR